MTVDLEFGDVMSSLGVDTDEGWIDGAEAVPVEQNQVDENTLPQFIATALNEIKRANHRRRGSKRSAAISEFGNVLRGLVDQWLDSGKSPQGRWSVDEPYRRDICWHSSAYPEPLFRTLSAFWKRNPPRIAVGMNGRLSVALDPSVSLNPKKLILEARARAIYYFQQLLESPHRELLARCAGCGTYFVRARAPKKNTPIKHGTFCKACKGKGSVRRTLTRRDAMRDQIIELAAECLPKWKPQGKHPQAKQYGEMPKWVAAKVNGNLPATVAPITGKWVTQNQDAIELVVKRGKNAEG
jgi:hypothetical protein